MFNIFNKESTKIVGSIFRPLKKTTEEIKLERINLDRKIYGVKTNENQNEMVDNKKLLEAKKNLNRN